MLFKKITKNKRGASMLDYFIISMVSILIGSSIMLLGAEIKKGVNLGKSKVADINKSLENK